MDVFLCKNDFGKCGKVSTIFRSSPPTPLSSSAAPSPPLYHRYYQDCNTVNTSGNLPITLHKY